MDVRGEITLRELTEFYEMKIKDDSIFIKCTLTTQSGYSAYGISVIPTSKHFNRRVGKQIALAQAFKHFVTPINVKVVDVTGSPKDKFEDDRETKESESVAS